MICQSLLNLSVRAKNKSEAEVRRKPDWLFDLVAEELLARWDAPALRPGEGEMLAFLSGSRGAAFSFLRADAAKVSETF